MINTFSDRYIENPQECTFCVKTETTYLVTNTRKSSHRQRQTVVVIEFHFADKSTQRATSHSRTERAVQIFYSKSLQSYRKTTSPTAVSPSELAMGRRTTDDTSYTSCKPKPMKKLKERNEKAKNAFLTTSWSYANLPELQVRSAEAGRIQEVMNYISGLSTKCNVIPTTNPSCSRSSTLGYEAARPSSLHQKPTWTTQR